MLAALIFLAGCRGASTDAPATADQPRIVLNVNEPRPTIDIVGAPTGVLAELGGLQSREAWTTVFKVAVGPEQLATVGQYSIEGDRIRFTPMFPLDRGRQYLVTFTAPGGAKLVTGTVALPPIDTTPSTVVAEVYPTTDVVPANQLRLYIQFSAPMGMRGGLDLVHLLDESGQEVKDPFLPLDAEFFNEDRTRYTAFFDPSRPLTEGKYYTLVIDSAWRDGKGLPLKDSFRRKIKAGPPDDRPLDPKTWKISAPAAGSTDPLVVAFPEPLDDGLLRRALSVTGPDKKPLDGAMKIGPQEVTWSFAPAEPWTAGPHNIVASWLEDLAGNGIGRAFDAENFDRADRAAKPERTLIPVVIK